MDKRKQRTAEADLHLPELPTNITFFHILPRLPVKSVSRFKRVSKQWHSFLTEPAFHKMHFHHASSNKMVVLSSSTTPYEFHTIDCERPKEGFNVGRPLPFKVEPRQRIRILTSVHGLVCVGIANEVMRGPHKGMYILYSDLILWNPAMGDHKTLSKRLPSSHQDCYSFHGSLSGLYHSSWDDDYKLLRVTRRLNVYIYSLKSDSWRKVESDLRRTRVDVLFSYFWGPGPSVSLNENMYFLKYDVRNPHSIVRFNTKTETLKLIATPFLGDENRPATWLSFTVLRDRCIHLWVNIENSSTLSSENELWRMDEDENWTKVENFILSDPIRNHHRLHLMRNGNMLMYDGDCVYQLDMKTNTRDLCSYTTAEMCVWQGGKYIETMVSPNRYTN